MITNFSLCFQRKKQNLQIFLAKECLFIDNGSTLSWFFPLIIYKSLSDVDIIVKLIMIIHLRTSKYHIQLLSYKRRLHIRMEKSKCFTIWQKKKKDKQSDKNYWLASFHPTCSKVFERIIYNKMFAYFTENNLVPKNQSRFRPAGSCVNQTLAICNLFSNDQSGLKPAGSCVKQLLAITH